MDMVYELYLKKVGLKKKAHKEDWRGMARDMMKRLNRVFHEREGDHQWPDLLVISKKGLRSAHWRYK